MDFADTGRFANFAGCMHSGRHQPEQGDAYEEEAQHKYCKHPTIFMKWSGIHIYITSLLLVLSAVAGVCHGHTKTDGATAVEVKTDWKNAGKAKMVESKAGRTKQNEGKTNRKLSGEKQIQGKEAVSKKELINYTVVGKDTIYLEDLPAAKVYARLPKQKGKEWRRYYRLVHNFSKAYPYALVAKKIVMQADSTIESENMKWIRKGRYVDAVQEELFEAFEKPLRKMTISQGMLLMKLIDREVGKSSYDIIKDFKNRLTAGFWQGVAKLFGSDLKKPYDPEGEDAQVEELVKIWEAGDFPALYFSLFWKDPPEMPIPEKYR